MVFPGGSEVKNLPAMQETRVLSLGQEMPWRRKWQPTPVFLPGEFNGQRILQATVYGVTKSQTGLSTEQQSPQAYLIQYPYFPESMS